jgi:hypothetical protein
MVETQRPRYAACNAPFDECEVSLVLFGADLEPEAVTKLLGCEPTDAVRAGDRLPTRGGKERTATVGRWNLTVTGTPPTLPGVLALELLDRLPDDAQVWASLGRAYQVQIRFAFTVGTLTGCFELDEEPARRLAATGATLAFHFYSHVED